MILELEIKFFFISNYSKIGLSGDYGISWFLSHLLGESKAKEIMMLNERIYADEALKLGLLNFLFKKSLKKMLLIFVIEFPYNLH